MEGKIYIDGKFGEGITLESVQKQVMSLGELTVLNVDFNSGGGDVNVGYAIYDYFDNLKKSGLIVNTNIVGVCASITTVPFLAGQKRTRTPHSSLMIHNPWMQSDQPMEAKDHEEAAVYLREEENKLANFYASKLQADVNEIKDLMKVETRLDINHSKSIGFINANSIEYRAVASVKLNDKDMDKKEGVLKDIQAKLSRLIKGEDVPQAAEMTLADGTIVMVDSEDGEFVGKSITLADGSSLEDGTYDLEDGRKLTVVEGMISEVMEAEEPEDVEALKSENESLKAELEGMKAAQIESASALDEASKANAEMKESIDGINETVNALMKENKVMASITVGGRSEVKAAVKTPKVKKEVSGLASGLAGFLKLDK